jgi:hypothetical protein
MMNDERLQNMQKRIFPASDVAERIASLLCSTA